MNHHKREMFGLLSDPENKFKIKETIFHASQLRWRFTTTQVFTKAAQCLLNNGVVWSDAERARAPAIRQVCCAAEHARSAVQST